VVAPRPDHRWLPALSTIVWALRNATGNVYRQHALQAG
jgi:hypothetical protein